MDTSGLSDYSNAMQADILGIGSPTPTSDAASNEVGSDPDMSTSKNTLRNQMLAGLNTPTGTVEVPGQDCRAQAQLSLSLSPINPSSQARHLSRSLLLIFGKNMDPDLERGPSWPLLNSL